MILANFEWSPQHEPRLCATIWRELIEAIPSGSFGLNFDPCPSLYAIGSDDALVIEDSDLGGVGA